MTINITWDNLDEAIKQLRELAKKLERFPTEVAYESTEHIRYEGASPIVIRTGDTTLIKNVGDQVAFQEYGAGYPADVTTIKTDAGTFASYPGVWSENVPPGKNTFNQWIAKGRDLNEYPFNQEPQHKMQNEVERLRNNTEQKAKDYFK